MSRPEKIAIYIERQYVTERGSVRENVEGLFAEDVAYHVEGQTLTRDDIVEAVAAVRRSPRKGRRVEPSEFEEDGDTVRWHLSATIPGMGEDHTDLRQESKLIAIFNADGRISKVWSEVPRSD